MQNDTKGRNNSAGGGSKDFTVRSYNETRRVKRHTSPTGSGGSSGANTRTVDIERRRTRRKPTPRFYLALIFVAVAAAILLLCLFVFFNPNNYVASAATAGPGVTATLKPTPTPTPTPMPTPTPTPMPTVTPKPTPATMWGASFPDKFTAGEVIKNDSSVTPTVSAALSPRFADCTTEVIGSYKSAHVNVTLNKVQENGITYYVSDIYITDLKYFIAPFSDGVYSKTGSTGTRYFLEDIAKNNNAVIAVNGDFYSYNAGPVMRDGVLYRNEVYRDMLVLFKDGTMKTYVKGEYDKSTIDSLKNDAWDIWTFGPGLLSDGQPKTDFNSSVTKANPRTAVGYYEPGHYVFVTVDGRQKGYSYPGYTMQELSQLMYDLGCKAAFNLDGGGTAQLAFMGVETNSPCSDRRKNRDALCIVDEPSPETSTTVTP